MRQDLTVGDEFYASLVYKPMIADGLDIAVYELQHFMQWGTPEDLREYQRWSATFARLASEGAAPAARHGGSMLMPMAGLGKRFSEAGYATPKPLIPVSGLPMAVQATRDLPAAPATRFVLRRDLPERETVEAELARSVPGGSVRALDGLTDGQAAHLSARARRARPRRAPDHRRLRQRPAVRRRRIRPPDRRCRH